MEKIWIYLAIFLAGVVVGIIIWEKIGVDDVFKGTVRIKQRGRGNVQSPEIKAEITPKESRKEKRAARLLDKAKNKD